MTKKGEVLTFGEKIFIPKDCRRELLKNLHSSHLGEDRMYRTVRQIWVWPGMHNQIKNYVKQCPTCNEFAKGKPLQPPQEIPETMMECGPMDRVGADLFHFAGKEYLVAVDFFSGYKWVTEMKRLDTNEVIKHLSHWFSQGCGFPRSLRCDSGPQFRSSLNNWLEEVGVVRETSSAYNPQSNGLAEKAVQDIKACMKKQTGKWELEQVVRETNNTARAGMDCTPADLFSGRVVRSNTPASARRTIDFAKARKKRMDDQLRIRRKLGRGKLSSETFMIGDRVRLQDPKSLRWSVTGIVTKTISHQGSDRPSSYEVIADNDGGTFLRNGRFLRLREQQPSTENADTDSREVDTEPDNTEDECDRSDDSGDSGDSGVEMGRDNKHAEAEYRQSREDSEGQGMVYRRSPRIKKQYRVTYKEDHSSGSRNGRRRIKGSRRNSPSPDIGGR